MVDPGFFLKKMQPDCGRIKFIVTVSNLLSDVQAKQLGPDDYKDNCGLLRVR